MTKLGVNFTLDVTKIDKARIFQGKTGKFIDLTAFIDPEKENQQGNHGVITHNLSKEEMCQRAITEHLWLKLYKQ